MRSSVVADRLGRGVGGPVTAAGHGDDVDAHRHDDAAERAEANDRRTVQPRDLSIQDSHPRSPLEDSFSGVPCRIQQACTADTPDTERQAGDADAREVLSVSQLNDRIASVVEETPAIHGVRCTGEVTDLHQNSTARYHVHRRRRRFPVWSGRYRETHAKLEDGTEVILEGDIDYWVEGGKVDLTPLEAIVVIDGDQAAAVE